MLLPEHRYHRPATLDDCLKSLAELHATAEPASTDVAEPVRVVAGGTDVIFNMRLRLFRPANLISIRRLPELARIEWQPDGSVRIGAASRLADLAEDPMLRQRYPAFVQAVEAVASAHVRTLATLGGNLCLETRCWYTNNSDDWRQGRDGCYKTDCQQCHVIPGSQQCHAINNADTPLALIALDARVTLQTADEQRELSLTDFYQRDGLKPTVLKPGELLTYVTLPPCHDRIVFLKFSPRRGMDFALGAVAARITGSNAEVARTMLVLGSISSAPLVLEQPARTIEQLGLSDAAIEAAVGQLRGELGELTNLYARATYKKQLARTLLRRALQQLRTMEAPAHG